MSDGGSTEMKFDAPGPGPWETDPTHFPRPASRFIWEYMTEAMPRGFAEGTARYGLLLSHIQPGIVNGIFYQQPVAFGAPKGAMGPPPKIVLQLLTRLHPAMRKRIRAGKAAFENKVWNEDLRRWDEELKPAAIRKHKELQAVDPAALDTDALCKHVARVRDHHRDMIYQHHQFTIASCVAIGDFLAHVQAWTGKSVGELLHAFKGASPVSAGAGADELAALASAVRDDVEAAALLRSDAPAGDVLDKLRAHAGPVGAAARAYVDVVGYRSLGYDVSEKYGLELPHVLVGTIRAAVDNTARGTRGDGRGADAINALREAVPAEQRARFDELFAEARRSYRLRDERGVYSDGWACGIARHALLEAGRRLRDAGKLEDPELVVNLSPEEVLAMLRGAAGPGAAEVRRRDEFRTTKSVNDVPAFLNARPAPPPPAEWLPEDARRGQRAVAIVLANLFGEPPKQVTANSVKGLAVSPGVYEGAARLIMDQKDFGRIQQGDVLVTRSTSPYFNVVLPLLGAIVTDRGGQLSHAAIVSREYGIPGVVGTTEATKLIRDGQRVRVDGNTGEVTVIA